MFFYRYRKYVHSMNITKSASISREEWNRVDKLDGPKKQRALREFSRNAAIRDMYYLDGMVIPDSEESKKAVSNASKYINERIVALLENVSNPQLSRAFLQAVTVSTVYLALLDTNALELSMLIEARDKIDDLLLLRDQSAVASFISKHIEARKEFRFAQSMINIYTNVSNAIRGPKGVVASTIRKWHNEYGKYGGFKEEMRGVHVRFHILDELGFSERFAGAIQMEKRLSVDRALFLLIF